jgi:hypothetical protein
MPFSAYGDSTGLLCPQTPQAGFQPQQSPGTFAIPALVSSLGAPCGLHVRCAVGFVVLSPVILSADFCAVWSAVRSFNEWITN